MSQAPQIHRMTVAEGAGNGRNIAIDCKGGLDSGELLTGALTIPAVSGLTFASNQVSTTSLVINDRTVPAGEAMQFNVKGTTPGTYEIDATAATDSSPAQTIEATIFLIIE